MSRPPVHLHLPLDGGHSPLVPANEYDTTYLETIPYDPFPHGPCIFGSIDVARWRTSIFYESQPLPSKKNLRNYRRLRRQRLRPVAHLLSLIRIHSQPIPTVLITEILSFLSRDVDQKHPL